jgi:DNA polymerase-4
VQSISAEQTFEQDLPAGLVEGALPALAEQVWRAAAKRERVGRTVVLKLKTADFRQLTRHLTPLARPGCAEDILQCGRQLLARVGAASGTRYRLAGLGLSNFTDVEDERQAALFDAPTPASD